MEKRLPQEYEDKKINLKPLNIAGFAWKREDLIRFLEDPRASEFAILGGDVLAVKEGKLSYTYDNWSAPGRPKTESFISFCQRTKEAALRYVLSYPQDEAVVFAPVITSEVTAGWEA